MIDEKTTTATATFRAMGTTIELTGVGISDELLDDGLHAAILLADQWETTFSRFLSHSELSRLNATSGDEVVVSDDLFWIIERAIVAYIRTRGGFDPTVLPALVASGYDRDIDLVKQQAHDSSPHLWQPAPGVDSIRLDVARSTVQAPAGVQLDLGGIAKGAFVDRLAMSLMNWPGGCVNAGGDLRVWGTPPDGEHWVVGIEDPLDADRDLAAVSLLDGRAYAVATSATNRRRWTAGGRQMHHLIDPATGAPVAGDLLSCTVFAASAIDAEIAAKSVFISTSRQELPLLVDAAAAVAVDRSSMIVLVEGDGSDAIAFHEAAPYSQSA